MNRQLQNLIDNLIVHNEQKVLYIGTFLDELKYLGLEPVFELEPDFKDLNSVDTAYLVAMSTSY